MAELGLAPLGLEALDLRLTRAEALGLVIRLGMLAEHQRRMAQIRAESARAGHGPED